jgi:hypothetical protein
MRLRNMRFHHAVIAAVLTLPLVLGACRSPEEKTPREEAPQAGPDTAGRAEGERNSALARMRAALDTMKAKVDTLRKASARGKAKTREEMDAHIRELEVRRDRLDARLDSLGRATAEGWEELKRKTQSELDSLKASLDRVGRRDEP